MILADGKTRANPDVLRKAAKLLGVEAPKARGAKNDQELLGNLRLEIGKRLSAIDVDAAVKCGVCDEISTEDTSFCPFCGDEGGPEQEAAQAAAAAAAAPAAVAVPVATVGIAKTPVPTAANVEVATAALEEDLAARLARITELKRSAIWMSYDIGLECKEIRDRQLYKARGYTSFKQFAEAVLPFTRESALQLIAICEKHTRQEYAEIGYAKLRVIAAVTDPALKEELVEAARNKATTTELKERVTRATIAPNAGGKKPTAAPEPGERITLLGKVGARAQVMKFHDAKKGGELLELAGTFKGYTDSAYGELEIGDGVFIRIGLRVNETSKQLEALTVRFVRGAEAAE